MWYKAKLYSEREWTYIYVHDNVENIEQYLSCKILENRGVDTSKHTGYLACMYSQEVPDAQFIKNYCDSLKHRMNKLYSQANDCRDELHSLISLIIEGF